MLRIHGLRTSHSPGSRGTVWRGDPPAPGGARPRAQRQSASRALLAAALLLVLLSSRVQPTSAFSLAEWLGLADGWSGAAPVLDSSPDTLTMAEISELRVRDIKRRLARRHGYDADELGRMLDKRELINALSFEEHKARQREGEARRRFLLRRGIVAALVCVIVTTFWPLFTHVAEVAHVNLVMYTDKKRYEMSRCRELRSKKGYLGVLCMFIVDLLSVWLTVSVILSWVTRSKYFFPVPHIPIRPAALLAASTGGAAGGGPLSRYGLNVGPMLVTWALRFVNGRMEGWTGRALSEAHKWQRKEAKAEKKKNETPEEREARRAARAARRAEKEARKQAAAAAAAAQYAEWDRMHASCSGDVGCDIGSRGGAYDQNAPSEQSPAPSREDVRNAAADAAEKRCCQNDGPDATTEHATPASNDSPVETGFDDLD